MGLSGEMHYLRDPMLLNHAENVGLVAKIDLLEDVLRVSRDVRQVRQMSSVGQTIEIDQPDNLRFIYNVADEIGADEAGSSGNQ